MAEVTKVKRLNELMTVLWEIPNGADRTKLALEECKDVPEKEFLDQFATVEADLVAKAGGTIDPDAFTLTGVSMSRNTAGRRQFKPSGKVDLGWGETGISIPLLLEPDSEKPSGADNVLSTVELQNIETLFELGLKYAKGERHQAGLELGDDDDPGPGDDPMTGEPVSKAA